MTSVGEVGVAEEEETIERVEILNATPEETVFSNDLLVHLILDNLPMSDLKCCARVDSIFHSEATKLLDKKSIICLNSSSRQKSYLESLRNGGRMPTTSSIVDMVVRTPQESDHFPRIPFKILRRIGGDKVRFLKIHDMIETFLPKSVQLLSLTVNLVELELDFKYGETNYVAALPVEDTFVLPNLKKLCLSVYEEGQVGDSHEKIRPFLQRFFAICPNLESYHGSGFNNACRHVNIQIFLEELVKIPGRMEKMKELSFTPDDYNLIVPIFRDGNFSGLRVLEMYVNEFSAYDAEQILEHFKTNLTKLVINLGGVYDQDLREEEDEESVLKLPVMENLEELELFKSVHPGEQPIGVVINAPSEAGLVFGKLRRLEISVALMRTMILADPNTTPARFPVLTRICFDEREETPEDEMLDEIWDLFPTVGITRFT